MVDWIAYALVFLAGLITALATGLGALPFFFIADVSDELNVALWGIAAGIMGTASVFGLIPEGLNSGPWTTVAIGIFAGGFLVLVAKDLLMDTDIDSQTYEEADFKKLILILGVLTVHSFPEGIAIGVSFAELDLGQGLPLVDFAIPALAIAMTVAISIHNIPEGVAISISLRNMGVPEWKMVWWSVFSSLPQPIGAVIAFGFVQLAQPLLPAGFGFAAGAMIYLVITEFFPSAFEAGENLDRKGYRELIVGFAAGSGGMILLLVIV